ncbi:MAG: hypothetical protein AB7N76_03220 [Planctomycetota bacterium]
MGPRFKPGDRVVLRHRPEEAGEAEVLEKGVVVCVEAPTQLGQRGPGALVELGRQAGREREVLGLQREQRGVGGDEALVRGGDLGPHLTRVAIGEGRLGVEAVQGQGVRLALRRRGRAPGRQALAQLFDPARPLAAEGQRLLVLQVVVEGQAQLGGAGEALGRVPGQRLARDRGQGRRRLGAELGRRGAQGAYRIASIDSP